MSALKRSLRIDLSRVQINTNKAVIFHYLSTFQKILDFSRVFCYCRLSDNSNLGAEQSTPRNGVRRPSPPDKEDEKNLGTAYAAPRNGGERGIRTLGTVLAFTRFPVVRLRPAQPSLRVYNTSNNCSAFFIVSQKN